MARMVSFRQASFFDREFWDFMQHTRMIVQARHALVHSIAAVLVVGVVVAQTPSAPAQGPVFRTSVDSVSVDVSVMDKDGRPVTDLTAADFEIRESGKLQAVETFKFVRIDDGIDDPRAARDILSFDDHTREAAREDNRLFVVFLDDYHVRRENGMRVREQIAQFLRQLSPHDLVAIATPLSGAASLTFSRNHLAVAASVMGFEGRKYDYTPKNAIEERYQNMPVQSQEQMRNNLVIAALANICEHLGTLRDGRKSLVYVSEGMSGSVPAGVRVRGPQMSGRTVTGTTENSNPAYDFFENSSLILDLSTRVFRTAARNNVAMYPLDPRGLANFEFGVDEDVSNAVDRRIVQESTDLLRVVAEQTDGRAIVGRNDPLPALRQMVRDASAYYLLGYTSTEAFRDGKFHEIQVRVKRRDVEVRARKGYWAYSAEEVARASAPARSAVSTEVMEALDGLADASSARGRVVTVWMGARRGATERPAVTLAWEVPVGDTPRDPIDQVDRVSIVATTLSGIEMFRGVVPKAAGTTRPTGAVTFASNPGPLRVQVTAENARGQRIDATDKSLEVPDFTTTGPQIAAPFLYRGRTVRELQLVRTATDPAPAVSPVFGRAERMLMRFGAYGPAGTTPKVTIRLLNQLGGAITTLPPPVAGTSGEFESELGFGSFPPGDYVIEIVAEIGDEMTKRFLGVRVTG
jgi:VWFA-related protein